MNDTLHDLERRTRALLASDRVTAPTRAALSARLAHTRQPSRALDARQFATLQAVARRLIPSGDLEAALDLAGRLDEALADGPGDGWRYADMPTDRAACGLGLDALEASAAARFGQSFVVLAPDGQDAILAAVQRGDPPDPGFPVDPRRWFEETLAALTELAYGHPLMQVAIGYDGMADAHGWQGPELVASQAVTQD